MLHTTHGDMACPQAVNLTTLPTDVFAQILGQVLPSDKAALRLVSRQLAAAVRGQLTHASTARHISRRAAVSLQHSFPRLTSLALINPVSTHHLQLLSRLTCITFAPSKRSLGSLITVDLAPLEDLPRLHTLHLEQVQMQQLSTSPSCVMAALTQLQALRLVGCASSDKGAQDLAALPGVTKLQVVDKSPAGLARLNGLQNLHKVCTMVLRLGCCLWLMWLIMPLSGLGMSAAPLASTHLPSSSMLYAEHLP